MLEQWRHLLEESGAEFSEGQLVSYGNPDRERRIPPQGDIICDLSQIGMIRVQGEDAADFLQNQLTNDINDVSEFRAQLSAWCNPKGRTIATFLIHQHQESYYLALAADLMEYVLKRLKMYVLRSRVVLEDVTGSVVHFGFSGSHILEDWDACCEGELPTEDYGVVRVGDVSIIKVPGMVPRYEVVGEFEEAARLWQKLNVRAAPVSASAWAYLNIASGIPTITQASQEAWIPQMLNLQAIGGVNFKKGCFPGQEIVARLKYLGKNKRRVFRVEMDTDRVPEVNDVLESKDEAGRRQEAGKVLNAVLNPDGKVEALAVLKIAVADSPLFLVGDEATPVHLLALPFSVEE